METREATIAGAVTYWSLAEFSNLTRIEQGLAGLGYDAFAPGPPSPAVALRRALGHVFHGGDRLIRQITASRFAVVNETRQADDLVYDTGLKAEVGSGEVVVISPDSHPAALSILDQYAVERQRIPGMTVGQSLAAIAAVLGGVRLRDTGGVFWIPEDAVETWSRVAEAFEVAASHGNTTVYRLRTSVDEASAEAVTAAITAEVEATVAEIRGKIRDQTRESALRRRVEESEALTAKIAKYEAILSRPLGALRKAAEDAEREASMAALGALGGGA